MKKEIEAILAKHDPVKLIKMGAPQDEYSSEAEMIWERTTRHFSQESIQQIVYDVFSIQFGQGTIYKADRNGNMVAIGDNYAPIEVLTGLIGKFKDYQLIAREIKELLDQQKSRAT